MMYVGFDYALTHFAMVGLVDNNIYPLINQQKNNPFAVRLADSQKVVEQKLDNLLGFIEDNLPTIEHKIAIDWSTKVNFSTKRVQIALTGFCVGYLTKGLSENREVRIIYPSDVRLIEELKPTLKKDLVQTHYVEKYFSTLDVQLNEDELDSLILAKVLQQWDKLKD